MKKTVEIEIAFDIDAFTAKEIYDFFLEQEKLGYESFELEADNDWDCLSVVLKGTRKMTTAEVEAFEAKQRENEQIREWNDLRKLAELKAKYEPDAE